MGSGGMGAVYAGMDELLRRKVAIKVPHVRLLADPRFRERFEREIKQLMRLEHPHVVRILASGEHDDLPFCVLQYLAGGSLEDRIARGTGRQTELEVLGWLGTVAATLDWVHEQRLVHRDVKPSNILFDEQGFPFLSDFGLVKAMESTDASLTGSWAGVGTLAYAAPEQALGTGIGPAADQYALAATVYEALAGSPPFGKHGGLDLVFLPRRSGARKPRNSRPWCP